MFSCVHSKIFSCMFLLWILYFLTNLHPIFFSISISLYILYIYQMLNYCFPYSFFLNKLFSLLELLKFENIINFLVTSLKDGSFWLKIAIEICWNSNEKNSYNFNGNHNLTNVHILHTKKLNNEQWQQRKIVAAVL